MKSNFFGGDLDLCYDFVLQMTPICCSAPPAKRGILCDDVVWVNRLRSKLAHMKGRGMGIAFAGAIYRFVPIRAFARASETQIEVSDSYNKVQETKEHRVFSTS